MNDRDALNALAAREPEPFTQTRPTAEDNAEWQDWHDRHNAALAYARALKPRWPEDYTHKRFGCIGC